MGIWRRGGLAALLLLVPAPALACQAASTLYFAAGSAEIDGAGRAAVENFTAQLLGRTAEIAQVRVVGHSDRTGPAAARQRIGLRRADTVRDLLFALGVPANLVATFPVADRFPAIATADNVGEPRNRRVELSLILKAGPAGPADQDPPTVC